MSDLSKNIVLIVAGGTGGHIFPGLAVASELKKHGVKLSWIGTARGLEKKVVKAENIPLFVSPFKGVRGKGLLPLLLLPFRLSIAVFDSIKTLKKIKPDYVACFGGYITVPVGISSTIMRIPFLVHEQNAVMGSANRILSRLTKQVFLSFKSTRYSSSTAKFVGNPIRSSFLSVPTPEERWELRSGPIRILVLGGSLGAKVLNVEVPKILKQIKKLNKLKLTVVHQTGENDRDEVNKSYMKAGFKAEVKNFLDEVITYYCWADLVICRAGAGTISELAAIGLGSVLIPLENAIDNHQLLNAKLLSNADAALLIEEKNIQDNKILSFFENLDRSILLEYAKRARSCSNEKSASLIATEIINEMVKSEE
ncbi:MAG: undecaprenyldiphospho-muramoylpentapeptide beta-N-acetylglucosaminyltransferase [Betaproteobacteria bacterium TMED156]|nr:MAG: undecaprenyldiphospho-muramoylpentapeptide beta-N-acetylglucosaminyltransferase [Betaproteobacteria bacterium TMED156]|tara:strand:- start:340 stop:1440 length:1101 start_codon:yes stop_codon:yes gene_type:complete